MNNTIKGSANERVKNIGFTKMQGCGNDYIYIDLLKSPYKEALKNINLSELAIQLSDRHFGIGSDGLILIEHSDKAAAYMHMFNADGSEGSMCGNGIRCTAKYLYDEGYVPSECRLLRVETKSGIRDIELNVQNGVVVEASVDMGKADMTSKGEERVIIRGKDYNFIAIDIGNPHAIYFLDNNPSLQCSHVSEINLPLIGPDFENHQRFPDRVNSEFIEVLNKNEIRFRVWERGSGETLACGTGASAAVAAGCMTNRLDDSKEVLVHLLGGDLYIQYNKENGHCIMRGPAVTVFKGELKL